MNEMDEDLQRRLKRLADEATPDARRESIVLARSRSRRRLVALASGVMTLLLVGGIAGASMLWGPNQQGPGPSGEDTDVDKVFARYFFETGSRDASASGVLEVNLQEGTLCYEASTENMQASHLLRNTGVVGGGRRFERMIVVTFFDPEEREQGTELPPEGPICFQKEQLGELNGNLQLLIDHPEDFRVDFHRGPNDDPGLIAALRESPEREHTAEPTDIIEAQGGTIRLVVDPRSPKAGTVPHALLINDSERRIGYGHSYVLETRTSRGWRPARSKGSCGFTEELIPLEPGDDASHAVGTYDTGCDVVPLRAGTYRVTKTIELDSGEAGRLSIIFRVNGGPVAPSSIEDAVAFLARRLDVDVALPPDLPPGIRLAQGQSVTVERDGNVKSGRLELRYGKKGILILDFGDATFDGCGGGIGAVNVDINGVPGVMLAKDRYPWTQIIWPARPGDTDATYGIYGSLRSEEMLDLARSMQVSIEDGGEKTQGCL